MSAEKKKQVLILGGGFGGVRAALELSGHAGFEITLVSDHPDFRYYPTLYRVATGGSRDVASIPLKEIFAGLPVALVVDFAAKIERESKIMSTKSGRKFPYDYLIIGLGVVTNYFGIKGLQENSLGIKTLQEAQNLRDHLHRQLVDDNRPDLNYVIIGGGPTGVELAGSLSSYIRHIMQRHGVPKKAVNIEIIEAEPRLLPRMPKNYSKAVQKRLRRLGVKIFLNQKVESQTADDLIVNGRPLRSHTVVWTAGVSCHPFFKENRFSRDMHGKVLVDQYLQAEPGIYVVGDNAATPYSGMAQTALRDGDFVGRHLIRMQNQKELSAYTPKKPIYITPVGKRWAALLWGNMHAFGWTGWVLRAAADWIGYRDLEPFLPASKRWLALGNSEESCAVCFKKTS